MSEQQPIDCHALFARYLFDNDYNDVMGGAYFGFAASQIRYWRMRLAVPALPSRIVIEKKTDGLIPASAWVSKPKKGWNPPDAGIKKSGADNWNFSGQDIDPRLLPPTRTSGVPHMTDLGMGGSAASMVADLGSNLQAAPTGGRR